MTERSVFGFAIAKRVKDLPVRTRGRQRWPAFCKGLSTGPIARQRRWNGRDGEAEFQLHGEMTMSASRIFRSTLIGAAVAVLVSAPAFAATQTFTVVQPSVAAPQGAVFQLPQFNPALGTLTQVDLTWVTSAQINAQIFQNGSAGSAFVDGADLQFTFNAPQVSITQLNEPIFAFAWPDGTASPIVIASSNPAFVGNGQQVNSANWAPYIGPGTFNVQWAIEEFDFSAGPVWVGDGGFERAVLDARLGGYDFSVTYNYRAVPEPASLALLGLGLAGLGLARRRKA